MSDNPQFQECIDCGSLGQLVTKTITVPYTEAHIPVEVKDVPMYSCSNCPAMWSALGYEEAVDAAIQEYKEDNE